MFEQIEYQGKKYPLSLTFDAVRTIEQSLGKSIIRLDSSKVADLTIALSAASDLEPNDAFEAIKELGIEVVAVAVQTLIIETFNPEKKKVKAAKKQTA